MATAKTYLTLIEEKIRRLKAEMDNAIMHGDKHKATCNGNYIKGLSHAKEIFKRLFM